MARANLLADDRVAREHLGRLGHRLVARRLRADRERAAPLGELAAALLVLSAARVQVVQALRRLLAERARQRHQALVHLRVVFEPQELFILRRIETRSVNCGIKRETNLNARDESALLDFLDEGSAIVGLLTEGLIEEDHAAEVFADLSRRSQERLAILPPDFLGVLEALCGELLADACYYAFKPNVL